MLLFVLRCRRRLLLPPSPRCDRLPLLFSSSASGDGGDPSAKPLSIAEHLVTRWGISAAEASKASKHLAHLKSTKKPDSVLAFFKSQGFGSPHLDRIVALLPGFLCADVEKSLAPKLQSLRDVGISESDVIDIVLSNPHILRFDVERTILPKLQFWESFFGSRERLLTNMRSKRSGFFNSSIEKRVNPNVKLLMVECGVTKEKVFSVAKQNVSFITQKSDSFRSLLGRADEVGVPRQSKMFLWVMFYLFKGGGTDKVDAKLKVMTSFGWSKSEFFQAVAKAPYFLCISQNNMQKKMKFLVEEVGCEPSSIAHRPLLLVYNLEKRTIPRVRVMEMLQLKGLAAEDKLLKFLRLTEKQFQEKFVHPHVEKVPDLLHILGVPEKGDQRL